MKLIALLLRGDHSLNEIKAEKHPLIAAPLSMASDEQIQAQFGCDAGYLGPLNCPLPMLVDHAALAVSDFACGANKNDAHLRGVNWGRDLEAPVAADLRMVVEGDPAPEGQGSLRLIRGIEVGHIFQLGDKYSSAMKLMVLDADGREQTPLMGCYGIGVSRIAAAVIEQSHDQGGMIWPQAVAPFELVILPINLQKSERVRAAAEQLYQQLRGRRGRADG